MGGGDCEEGKVESKEKVLGCCYGDDVCVDAVDLDDDYDANSGRHLPHRLHLVAYVHVGDTCLAPDHPLHIHFH